MLAVVFSVRMSSSTTSCFLVAGYKDGAIHDEMGFVELFVVMVATRERGEPLVCHTSMARHGKPGGRMLSAMGGTAW